MRLCALLCAAIAAAGLCGGSSANTVLVDAAAYPEGPLWRDGKLLYVEYAGPGIKMWDGKRATSYWQGEHCGASGLIANQNDIDGSAVPAPPDGASDDPGRSIVIPRPANGSSGNLSQQC